MSQTNVASPEKAKGDDFHSYPWWGPRFWHGMGTLDWWKLLVANRLAVHPIRWVMALLISLITPFNSVMAGLQRLIFGGRLARTKILPPVFVLGHWRSGTTLLHELFMLDEKFTTPSTCQCFVAKHFLLTGGILSRWFRFLLPSQRPMDNVAAGWDRPQEDEFALVALGAPSPYRTMAFCNNPPQCQEYLDFDGVPERDVEGWKRLLRRFLTEVTYQTGKPIVLKSPPHTGRIRVLLEMFPDARFVHIVRDPYVVFPSTMRLWTSMYDTQGLQRPRPKDEQWRRRLEEFVFSSFERMYGAFERDRALVPAGRIVDVRYEDLARDPVGEMKRVYETLGLAGFAEAEPRFREQTRSQGEYKTNRYSVGEEIRGAIDRRWRAFIERYGY